MPSRRILFTAVLALTAAGAMAQQTAPAPKVPFFETTDTLLYAMVVLAVVQVIFIVALAGILRTLGGPGGWVKKLMEQSGRAAVTVPLVLLAASAQAQAYQGDGNSMTSYGLFWWLAGVNVLLFVIILVQVRLVRSLTAVVTGNVEEVTAPVVEEGPSWVDRLLAKMTRQVKLEEEKDIELHHDYDGIKELDNVLPPWWLWLFYVTIIWGVIYLVNVHVINVWPQQDAEYAREMKQAKDDVDAYLATLTNTVDENNVTFTDDAAVIGAGRALYTTYCTPCHGADAAGSETSVGPNLTDAYWLHGGGIKNIFKTIKYGVPAKGMIAWKAQLQPAEIRSIASYIMTLEGKGGPGQKEPQGEVWKEEGAAATDSTAVPADTTKGPLVDTVRVAMQ